MKLKLLLLIFALSSTIILADGGSNYSIFGIGDLNKSSGPSYESMAGTSVAMPLETAINLNNPAMWSYNTSTRFQVGYRFNQNLVSDANQSLYQNNGKIDGFHILFSIDTSIGLSSGLGLFSNSSQNYYVSSPLDLTIDSIRASGKTLFQGTGGITSMYFGLSVKPLNFLSIGLQGKAYFGVSDDIVRSLFNENYTFESLSRQNRSFKGGSFRPGISLLFENFTFGAFYETSPTMTSKNTTTYYSSLNKDTLFTSSTEFAIPSSFGIGLSYLTGKFLIGFDYKAQNFTNFNFKKLNNVEYTNGSNISLGIMRYGSTMAGSSLLDKISYKFGAGYNKLYYKVNGKDIDEMYGSLGTSIPMPGTGVLELSLTIGKRGTTNDGLIQEIFAKLGVCVSIGDVWFKPFKREFE
ncbi:MAG: hypothetical protein NTW25_07810 [Candidatus Kapabacteria bacterium]|nr:hypothetical protein [Candidatus Kapabacteria bacterium]